MLPNVRKSGGAPASTKACSAASGAYGSAPLGIPRSPVTCDGQCSEPLPAPLTS